MSDQWQPQHQWNPYESGQQQRSGPQSSGSPGGSNLPAVPETYRSQGHQPAPGYPGQQGPQGYAQYGQPAPGQPYPGYPQQSPMPPPYHQQPVGQQMMSSTVVVHSNNVAPKSVGMAVLLAILFGPLGMLYSTILGAIVMFGINLILVFLTAGLGLFLSIPAGAVWAGVAAQQHNRSNTVIATNNNMR